MIAGESNETVRISQDALDQRVGDKPIACERLDSWKEIAAYLRRSVRCVQRWERMEGLPVRRHQHAKGATVYAYRHEVDQWWQEERKVVTEAWKNGADSTNRLQPLSASDQRLLVSGLDSRR
jgi:hypothetical protein